MTHITCRLTAKNRDHLRNATLGNRVWATFRGLPFYRIHSLSHKKIQAGPAGLAVLNRALCLWCLQFVRGGSSNRGSSARKSKGELLLMSHKDMFMELIRDIASELDVNTLCHKILVNVITLVRNDTRP